MDLAGRRITEEALRALQCLYGINAHQVVYRGRLYLLTDYDKDSRTYLLVSPDTEGSSPDAH